MQKKNSDGFTLVELIVTMSILAIIVTIAFPHIMTYLTNMEAKRIRYAVTNSLNQAKAESFIYRKDVLLCLSGPEKKCERDSDQLLLIFFDNNKNNKYDSATDSLIEAQVLNPMYGSMHLRAGNRSYVKFAGDSGNPHAHYGHIKYCPRSIYSQAKYQISFNQAGIIKYKPDSKKEKTDCPS